jgi:uncharacterized membrane protein YhaH (DUF805 family)
MAPIRLRARQFMDRFLFIWLHLKGRIDRRTWLGFAVLIGLLEYLTELILRRAFHWPLPAASPGSPLLPAHLGDEISLLSALIFLWPSLAIDIKRWHDLGMSGWAVLLVYGPAVVLYGLGFEGFGGTIDHPDRRVAAFLYLFGLAVLVYFIILAARKGMAGPNRYGPPPA